MFMLVIMMFAGYIYFTQAMRINTLCKIAAREGAREYSVTNNSYEAREKAKSELALGGIDPDSRGIHITTKKDNGKRSVIVESKYGFHTPFVGEYNLNLKGGADYILEQNPKFYGEDEDEDD